MAAVLAGCGAGCHARHQDFGFPTRAAGIGSPAPVAPVDVSPPAAGATPAAVNQLTAPDTQRLVARTKFENGRLTTTTDYADGPLGPLTAGGGGPPAFSFVPPSPLEAGR